MVNTVSGANGLGPGSHPVLVSIDVSQIVVDLADAHQLLSQRDSQVGLSTKVLEAFLLLQEVERSRLGRLVLEREVHALMPAVLLRLARLDVLQPDP